MERDLQVLGVRRLRELVTGKKWKDIVRLAKAYNGLYCQWKKKKKKIHIYFSMTGVCTSV
jgi:hypothetical protein